MIKHFSAIDGSGVARQRSCDKLFWIGNLEDEALSVYTTCAFNIIVFSCTVYRTLVPDSDHCMTVVSCTRPILSLGSQIRPLTMLLYALRVRERVGTRSLPAYAYTRLEHADYCIRVFNFYRMICKWYSAPFQEVPARFLSRPLVGIALYPQIHRRVPKIIMKMGTWGPQNFMTEQHYIIRNLHNIML